MKVLVFLSQRINNSHNFYKIPFQIFISMRLQPQRHKPQPQQSHHPLNFIMQNP